MSSAILKYITDGDKLILFNTYTFDMMNISGKAIKIFQKILPDMSNEKDLEKFNENYLSKLTNSDLKDEISRVLEINRIFIKPSPSEKKTVGEISFATIHECNLNCRYCFASAGRNYTKKNRIPSKEVTQRAIEFAIKDFFPSADKYFVRFVSGGEPFLNLDTIEFTYKEMEKYRKEKINIDMWICTNGTIYSDRIKDFLKKGNVSLGISLDGNKTFNDSNRVYKDNRSSYDDVIQTIMEISLDKELSPITRNLRGLVCITKNNMDLISIIEHHKRVGFKSIQMRLLMGDHDEKITLREDVECLKNNYRLFSEYIFNKLIQGDDYYLLAILNTSDYYGKIIKKVIMNRAGIYRCNATRMKISVTADGNIYPCDSFVGINEFCLGNIFTGTIDERVNQFYNLDVLSIDECSKCWAKYLCGGDCHYNCFAVNKDIRKPDKNFCEIQIFLCELAITFVSKLFSENKNLYMKIKKKMEIESRMKVIV